MLRDSPFSFRKTIAFALCAFLIPLQSVALYLGNPSEPDLIQEGFFIPEDAFFTCEVGYQGDYVFDRYLKAYGGTSGRIDQFQLLANQGVLSFILLDRIEVYGSLGAAEAYFAHRPKPDRKRREYQSSNCLTWGVGGRLLIVEWKNIALGIEGGYQWAYPRIKWDALNGASFTTGAKMRYDEWQVGFGLSYHIDLFTPYAAVKYSNVHAKVYGLRNDLELSRSHFSLTNRYHFGLVLGSTLAACKIFDLGVEVRLIDEQAISLTGNIKF